MLVANKIQTFTSYAQIIYAQKHQSCAKISNAHAIINIRSA